MFTAQELQQLIYKPYRIPKNEKFYVNGKNIQAILNILDSGPKTSRQIADQLGWKKSNNVFIYTDRLVRAGYVEFVEGNKKGYGKWKKVND